MRRANTGPGSVWTYLLVMFLAVSAAVAILPACGDDRDPVGDDSDVSDMDMDMDMDTDPGEGT